MLFSVTDMDPHLVTVKDRPHLWHPYFPCSSAIIEHTNRVIFLEDDDIAAVADGKLSIHRVKRSASDDPSRAIQTLQMELQQIMKGRCPLRVPVQQPHGAGALWGSSWDSLPCHGWALPPSCLLWAPESGCRWSVVRTSQGMWGTWPGYSKGGFWPCPGTRSPCLNWPQSINYLPLHILWDTFLHPRHHCFSGWEACSNGGLWTTFSLWGEPIFLHPHLCPYTLLSTGQPG